MDMGKKISKPSDISYQINRLEKIRNLIEQKEKTDRESLKFLKRYEQELLIIFKNDKFVTSVNKIRKDLSIPPHGFDIFKNLKNIKKWLTVYKQKNGFYDFQPILNILNNYKIHIDTDPTELLDFFVDAIIKDEEDIHIFYKKDDFIFICPSLEIYENYVNEKPFPGIFDFILFNEIFIPYNGLTALFDYNNHLLIGISVNTTKRNLQELWPTINKWQKEMNGYEKNKKRIKKNLTKGLKAIKYDKETKEYITKKELTGEHKNRYSDERKMDDLDNHLYAGIIPEFENIDEEKEKKYKQNRAKIKSRAKKLLGPK